MGKRKNHLTYTSNPSVNKYMQLNAINASFNAMAPDGTPLGTGNFGGSLTLTNFLQASPSNVTLTLIGSYNGLVNFTLPDGQEKVFSINDATISVATSKNTQGIPTWDSITANFSVESEMYQFQSTSTKVGQAVQTDYRSGDVLSQTLDTSGVLTNVSGDTIALLSLAGAAYKSD